MEGGRSRAAPMVCAEEAEQPTMMLEYGERRAAIAGMEWNVRSDQQKSTAFLHLASLT